MGIEILFSGPQNVGQTATFTFQNDVQAYVLGISAFYLTYGQDVDHWIQELQVKLQPSQLEAKVVNAQIHAQMRDSSAHTIDLTRSLVSVVCIANTGTFDANTLLTNTPSGISNNGTGSVSLPGSSGFSVMESFLAGFTLQNSLGDQQVLYADAECGITNAQSQGSVSASANLVDYYGNQANTALIDAGVAVSTDTAPGFFMQEVTAQEQFKDTVVTFNSMKAVSKAFAVLKSWKVQYGDGEHWVSSISAGFNTVTPAGNTVTVKNPYAGMDDNSGNRQDDSLSHVTLAVIAVP